MGFTGIVQEMGRITNVKKESDVLLWDGSIGKSHELTIECSNAIINEKTYIGESICVEGVCLTVTQFQNSKIIGRNFQVNVAGHTLDITSMGDLKVGDYVNLELAAPLDGRNSGHEVQGHVDCTSKIVNKFLERDNVRYTFQLTKELQGLVVMKGYVSISGTSLTVCEISKDTFGVMLVPHTQRMVTLGKKEIGEIVNVEAHCIAKHLKPIVDNHIDELYQKLRQEFRQESILTSLAFSALAFGATLGVLKFFLQSK